SKRDWSSDVCSSDLLLTPLPLRLGKQCLSSGTCSPSMTVVELLAQIARRDSTRTEATLQADIRQLVLTAPLSLSAEDVVTADLETPVGVRRRIDIEVGSCLIEVKRDLSAGRTLPEAIE